jgi:hypothetical protein
VNLFALPDIKDILKLHLVPMARIDPTQLTAAAIGADERLSIPIATTLLSAVSKQSFCPNATSSSANLTAVVTGESGTGASKTASTGQLAACQHVHPFLRGKVVNIGTDAPCEV